MTFTSLVNANPNTDQWLESEKTYKDLINEGLKSKVMQLTTLKPQMDYTSSYLSLFFKKI